MNIVLVTIKFQVGSRWSTEQRLSWDGSLLGCERWMKMVEWKRGAMIVLSLFATEFVEEEENRQGRGGQCDVRLACIEAVGEQKIQQEKVQVAGRTDIIGWAEKLDQKWNNTVC